MANEQALTIPKTIHYCWFGKREYPRLAEACMETWKTHMPNWKFVLWNEDNFPEELVFARKLLNRKLYAFVSDYVRSYAIWKEGGIYLDTDIEVLRPLDALLTTPQFLGCESEGRYTNAVCGGMAGSRFFETCLQEMDRHYEKTMTPILSPELCTNILNKNAFHDVRIYPQHVFYPYNPYDKSRYVSQLMYKDIKPDTLTIHHWAKTWRISLFRKVLRKLAGSSKR